METSRYWSDDAVGDGVLSPYDNDEFSDIWRILFQRDRALQGPIEGYLNELVVSNVGLTISVDTGGALVDGKYYDNNAIVSFLLLAPTINTRVDRVILRKSWALQTVRLAILPGIEGAGPTGLTQTEGVIWEIPIAQVSITIVPTVTVIDERTFSRTPLSLVTGGTLEEIQSISGDGVITSFNFQPVPQTFRHLRVIGTARIDSAVVTADLQLRFNNDSGANYNRQRLLGSNNVASAQAAFNQTEIDIGFVVGATGVANYVSQFSLDIPNYRQITFFKSVQSSIIHIPNAVVADFDVGAFGGIWQDTSAIDRITILNSSAGALIAGVRATLYGFN